MVAHVPDARHRTQLNYTPQDSACWRSIQKYESVKSIGIQDNSHAVCGKGHARLETPLPAMKMHGSDLGRCGINHVDVPRANTFQQYERALVDDFLGGQRACRETKKKKMTLVNVLMF